MPSLRSKSTIDDPFRRNERVKATHDLLGVPVGTEGRVRLVDGFRWIRYWVFFDNGSQLGSLDDHDLVRPAHWDEFFDRKAKQEELAAAQAEAGAAGADADSGATTPVIDANDPNAALLARIPPHLLERSAAARQRLGVPKP